MNAAIYVADAGAMLAYLRNEPGGKEFLAIVEEPGSTVYAHPANLVEVFYDVRRAAGEDAAQGAMRLLAEPGILFRDDLDRPFWEDAARLKADYRRVSLADCFGLALTRRVNGVFLSTDHHELEAINAAGVCRVHFVR